MNSPLQASNESRSPKFQITSWEYWTLGHTTLIASAVIAAGFVLRVREACGTFLNPDEALHFFIANRASLDAVYQASLTQAHPPLFFFMLYGLRLFGNSEILLRLPSIVAGTLFCWIFFKWLDDRLGQPAALVGLIYAACLPTMISVTAEVRQYGLLLFFLMCGLWFLDRGLEKDSPRLMLISAISLWLAILTHYSSVFFVAALSVYACLQIWPKKVSRAAVLTWLAGQLVTFSLVVFLYVTHLSKIKRTTMTQQALEIWLRRSYFHSGRDNPLTFLLARTFSVFQYIVGQLVVGDILTIVFVAGVVLLLRSKIQIHSSRQLTLAVLLILPFLLNYGAGLLDLYPFGGTRHCVYLSIFAITGIAIGTVLLTRQNLVRATTITLLIVVSCFLFRTIHHPYIARADQARSRMNEATAFVATQIPDNETILVDYESGVELGHYLCNQQVVYSRLTPDSLVFNCGNHRIISTVPDLWAFTPQTFLTQWAYLVERGYLKPGEKVWVCQAGWMVSLDEDLGTHSPEFHDLKTLKFGNNIRFSPLTVGSEGLAQP
ncbi:MAG TPA: glycosyltransferase family 39 protein [Terriglobales bacterium]|nr:glycosyltransferase family 39 protein [Terriglobales bacterium]